MDPAEFLTNPRFEDISEGSTTQKLRLLEPLRVYSRVLDDVVEVPAGFEFEESIPTVLFSLARPRGESKRAACVHDYLYKNNGYFSPQKFTPITRRQADAVYHELLRLKNVNPARAWVRWAAVRLGGAGHWKK